MCGAACWDVTAKHHSAFNRQVCTDTHAPVHMVATKGGEGSLLLGEAAELLADGFLKTVHWERVRVLVKSVRLIGLVDRPGGAVLR